MCPVCAILLDWQYLLTSEEESFNGDLWMQEHLMGKWVSNFLLQIMMQKLIEVATKLRMLKHALATSLMIE